jgi:hypothetical protein
MSAAESQGRADGAASAWRRARACLENKKRQIYEEVRNYPRPIPACDQQFNYLLEERARVEQELGRLEEACAESRTSADPLQRVEEFIRSSAYQQELRAAGRGSSAE